MHYMTLAFRYETSGSYCVDFWVIFQVTEANFEHYRIK